MKTTNWDAYYDRHFWLARWTRAHTARVLERLMRRFAPVTAGLKLAELGAGNSCFYDRLVAALRPAEYRLIDNNARGLALFAQRNTGGPARRVEADIFNLQAEEACDIVFSVGLIEHFASEDTPRALAAHLGLLKPGGIVVLTFPVATWLYRAVRGAAEALGLWHFPDERPLPLARVSQMLAQTAEVLTQGIIWPIVLTQGFVVARKRAARGPVQPSTQARNRDT